MPLSALEMLKIKDNAHIGKPLAVEDTPPLEVVPAVKDTPPLEVGPTVEDTPPLEVGPVVVDDLKKENPLSQFFEGNVSEMQQRYTCTMQHCIV